MRVLMLSSYPDELGLAVGLHCRILSQALAEMPDVEVHVVAAADKSQKEAVVTTDGSVIVHGLPTVGDFWLANQYRPVRRNWAKRVREINADVVHAQGSGMYAFVAGDTGLPWVVTLHGIFTGDKDFYFSKDVVGGIKRALWQRAQAKSIRCAKHLICQSPKVMEVLRRYTKATPHFIPNPIDEIYFSPSPYLAGGTVLFVGVVFPRKAIEDLLEAAAVILKEFPDTKFRIIGPVQDEAYYQSLLNHRSELDLEEAVSFQGHTSKTDLVGEYARASVFVLPSLFENAPAVIEEAMAVGRPTVATNVGGVGYLVDDGKTGFLVQPRDPSAFAEAVLRILRDPELGKRMGEEAAAVARDQFSPSAVAKRTLQVYEQILAEEGR